MTTEDKTFPLSVVPHRGLREYSRYAGLFAALALAATALWFISSGRWGPEQFQPGLPDRARAIGLVLLAVLFFGPLALLTQLLIKGIRGWRLRYVERWLRSDSVTGYPLSNPVNRHLAFMWLNRSSGADRELIIRSNVDADSPNLVWFPHPVIQYLPSGAYSVQPGSRMIIRLPDAEVAFRALGTELACLV